MSAERYRWIVTNRRTDREILNEIASIDAPLIIARGESPEILAMISRGQDSEIWLFEPAARDVSLDLEITRSWPSRLSLLVTPPESFGAIAISGSASAWTTAAEKANSVWNFLLRLQQAGAVPTRRSGPQELLLPNLGDRRRRKLTLPFPPLPDDSRHEIDKLAGITSFTSGPDVTALKAGLFQWHDALDESHECSQSIEGRGKHRGGDYWHAIMHRREPDYGNSKYWFRHVGRHPIFAELGQHAAPLINDSAPDWRDRLLRSDWDPLAFVDFCEIAARENNSAHVALAETIQEIEMLLLLASTYADAHP